MKFWPHLRQQMDSLHRMNCEGGFVGRSIAALFTATCSAWPGKACCNPYKGAAADWRIGSPIVGGLGLNISASGLDQARTFPRIIDYALRKWCGGVSAHPPGKQRPNSRRGQESLAMGRKVRSFRRRSRNLSKA